MAGVTIFLAMLYSVVVIPNMLKLAGFPPLATFISTCLVAAFGSLLMGYGQICRMAGCAVSNIVTGIMLGI
jgi:AGZA family xanthine/uracil permease-like MFS transporter